MDRHLSALLQCCALMGAILKILQYFVEWRVIQNERQCPASKRRRK